MKKSTQKWSERFVVLALGIALSGGIAGCGGSAVPGQVKTCPVTGTISLDGKGFGPARLVFNAIDLPVALQPTGLVDASGKITVTTYSAGDGLPAANYKIAISPDPMMPAPEHPQVYDNIATSTLTATISESGPNELKLNMDSKAGPSASAGAGSIPTGANLPPGTDPSKIYAPVVGPGAKAPTSK